MRELRGFPNKQQGYRIRLLEWMEATVHYIGNRESDSECLFVGEESGLGGDLLDYVRGRDWVRPEDTTPE